MQPIHTVIFPLKTELCKYELLVNLISAIHAKMFTDCLISLKDNVCCSQKYDKEQIDAGYKKVF